MLAAESEWIRELDQPQIEAILARAKLTPLPAPCVTEGRRLPVEILLRPVRTCCRLVVGDSALGSPLSHGGVGRAVAAMCANRGVCGGPVLRVSACGAKLAALRHGPRHGGSMALRRNWLAAGPDATCEVLRARKFRYVPTDCRREHAILSISIGARARRWPVNSFVIRNSTAHRSNAFYSIDFAASETA